VNTWRSQHGDQLRTIYQPRPNPAEMAAVTALYNSVRPRAHGAAAQRLEAAYQRCQQAAGQPGRRALYALWQAENELISRGQRGRDQRPGPRPDRDPTSASAAVGDAHRDAAADGSWNRPAGQPLSRSRWPS
jgi:hypothetical protein